MELAMVLTVIGYIIMVAICVIVIGSYFINVYRLIQRLNKRLIDLMTIFRVFGIFFPIVGVVLGFVKEEKIND